jgi:two-component system sensor histidine kinase DesK
MAEQCGAETPMAPGLMAHRAVPAGPEDEFRREQAKWRVGWRRFIFPGIWLVYLLQTASGVSKHSSGVAAIAGYVLIVVFCAVYLRVLPEIWRGNRRAFWTCWSALVIICAVETQFAHQDAFVMCVFIGVISVGGIALRAALPLLAVMAVTVAVVPAVIPAWHADVDWSDSFSLALVTLAMWGFFNIIRSNVALAAARADLARLAAENERTRIARDLHDLLGHSLTTITVKAGLARRLAERGDSERAGQEIAAVEELTRRALTDVRAAVSGYRDVNLAGELASAREVLRAAGIIATLPASPDIVDPRLQELFGWVVREGVTNAVRHSRAGHCAVRLGPTWVEVIDDGRGGMAGGRSGIATAGNGLTGLRERVAAVGGTVRTMADSGWRLRVEVPDPARAVEPDDPTRADSPAAAESVPPASWPAPSTPKSPSPSPSTSTSPSPSPSPSPSTPESAPV